MKMTPQEREKYAFKIVLSCPIRQEIEHLRNSLLAKGEELTFEQATHRYIRHEIVNHYRRCQMFGKEKQVVPVESQPTDYAFDGNYTIRFNVK